MMIATVVGGLLIGTSAGAMLLLEGRVAGVSGMLASVLSPTAEAERSTRLSFLVGLVSAGVIAEAIAPGTLPATYQGSAGRLIVAGLLVGMGARLANGCTSGHGLCGVARGSSRSIAAAAIFAVIGMLTLLCTRSLLTGGAIGG